MRLRTRQTMGAVRGWGMAWAAGAVAALCAPVSLAQSLGQRVVQPGTAAPTLRVGDAAPPLTIDAWVKGAAVEHFEPGKVYVVEFWATWCAPCRAAIPKVTDLQNRFRDRGVTVLAVSSREANGRTDVEQFVASQGDLMGYTVAWDKEEKSWEAWMDASGQDIIPAVFVVDRAGKLAWMGSPTPELEEVLTQVAGGTWDVAAYQANQQRLERERAEATKLRAQFRELVRANQWSRAYDLARRFVETVPGQAQSVSLQALERQLTREKDGAIAGAFATKLEEVYRDDAFLLNSAAWLLVESKRPDNAPPVEPGLALRMAQRAVDLTKSADVSAIDTLARAYDANGQTETALALLERSIAETSNVEDRAKLEAAANVVRGRAKARASAPPKTEGGR